MGIKNLYLVFIFCMTVPVWSCPAQERIIIPSTLTDTAFINAYIIATDRIAESNPDSAIKRYKNAYQMSRSINFTHATIYCLTKIGSYYFNNKQDYTQSRNVLRQALPYCKKLDKEDYNQVPIVYNLLGNAYYMTGSNDSAILCYNLALRAIDSLSLNLPYLLVTVYGNMGSVLAASRQYRQGANYIQKSLQLSNSLDLSHSDSNLLAGNYQNMGALYASYLNDMDSALYWWSFAINLYRNLSGKEKLQNVYANIAKGWLIAPHEDIKKAKRYLDSAIRTDPENARNNIEIQLGMGNVLYYQGAYLPAIKYCNRAIVLCDAAGVRERKQIAYNILSYCYAHLGDTLNSHKYQRLYFLLNDSLLNERITRSISQTEVLYRISEKDKKLAESKAALYRQRYWLAGITGLGLVLLISLLALIRNNKQKRRLQAEQMQNWEQQKKIEHFRVKAEAEEEERTRIARDLHDGVGVLLSAAMMNYTVLGKKNNGSSVSATATYREGLEILQEMQKEIRVIAHNLVPDIAARHDLAEAVQTLVRRMEQGENIKINLHLYGPVTALEPERSLSVYRMIEELIQNVMKHAAATEMLIQLMFHEEQLNIIVEDNGKGFDTRAVSGGMGLKNLNARVGKLNGYLSIVSHKGSGTTVELEVPFHGTPKDRQPENVDHAKK